MTDDPNARQIGGTHYQNEYQVWDFGENNGLGILEHAVIKYMCRWRSKGNGTADLAKAVHYIDKLIDLHKTRHRVPRGVAPHGDILYFCNMQELDSAECVAVSVISRWACADDLYACRSVIQRLIEDGGGV